MGKKFKTESELAAVIVEWLAAQGWEVHQEVQCGYAGARADVVAKRERLTWVVETKLSLSLALLEQAEKWTGRANFVSIAVPYSIHRKDGAFLRKILDMTGVGMFAVRPGEKAEYLNQSVPPRFNRRLINHRLLETLAVHKNYVEAGTPDGGYWTPFRDTCRALAKFVREHPGCTMKQAVDGIEHHYRRQSTAVSCLRGYLRDGVIKGIKIEENGRAWCLFPAEDKEAR